MSGRGFSERASEVPGKINSIMINLFRNIRRQLADNNQFLRYSKYAIGEIILVVIGILIALQVNEWNEDRKFQNEEDRILQELYAEFYDNRMVLKNRIKILENANDHIRTLLSYMNSPKEMIHKVNMDSIIGYTLKYGNFNPSNSTIQEMISSGRLNLISNKVLKKNLYLWLQFLEDSDEDFKNQDQQATTLLIPYLYKRLSMRNIAAYGGINLGQKSELFTGDYSTIFHDLEFENLYEGKLFWNMTMVKHYKELDSLAIKIMNQSKVE